MNIPIWDLIYQQAIIPVLVIKQTQSALPLAQALLAGGMQMVEVTLRSEAALPAIRSIHQHFPELVLAAGTVLTVSQAQQAVEAGCRFLVSPGLDDELAGWAQTNGIPLLAGAVTATEIMRGLKLGMSTFKFFPSQSMGGLETIQALADPFIGIHFIPTGGINAENVQTYLKHPRIWAAGGSWMARPKWIENGEWERITQETRAALSNVVRQ